MVAYTARVDAIAASTAKAVAQLDRSRQAGRVSLDEFLDGAETLVLSAVQQAAAVADAALAQRLTQLRRQDTAPLGLSADPPPWVRRELADAVGLSEDLGLVVRATTRQAGQQVFSQGLQDHGVAGWRRVTSGSDCRVCTGLAAAPFLPSRIVMYTHKGCGCHPEPIIDDPQGSGFGR